MDMLSLHRLGALLLVGAAGCAGDDALLAQAPLTAAPWHLDQAEAVEVVPVDGVSALAAPRRVIELDLPGRTLRLELQRNDTLFGADYTETVVGADGVQTTVPAAERADARPCYYQGTVIDLLAPDAPRGRVAVTTCDPAHDDLISGYLVMGGQDLALRSVGQAALGEAPAYELVPVDRPTYFDDLDDTIDLGALPGGPGRPTAETLDGQRPPPATAWVELHAVADTFYVAQEGGTTQAVAHMTTLVNAAGVLYLGALVPETRLVLVGQSAFLAEPYAPTVSGGETDSSSLLDAFRLWADANIATPHDDAVLFSGRDFDGGTVGLAPVGAACFPSFAAVIAQGTFGDPFVAVTVAHEIGHLLNMNHDSSGNGCPSSGFVMAAVGCAGCGTQPTAFSVCSAAYFDQLVQSGGASCLANTPTTSLGNVCGNGIVEAGEVCDVGVGSSDTCCNPATCQLAAGATCYGDQGCCDLSTCQPFASGHVCRSATGGCDVTDVCDGGADCPADAFTAAGLVCDDGLTANGGLCLEGDCASRASQCASLEPLFPGFEPMVACTTAGTTSCGNLLCGINGVSTSCFSFDLGAGNVQVEDGASCGTNRQCDGGSCVLTTTLNDQCPNDPNKTTPGQCGCGVPDTDSDGDGTANCLDQCVNDPAKTTPGVCGCGVSDQDLTGDGIPDCAVCGDGAVQAPETCDDGGRQPADGCSASCQIEPITLDPVPAGSAGQRIQLVVRGALPGETVYFVAGTRAGSTQVPGCSGSVPFGAPTLIGAGVANANGVATRFVTIPSTLAGRVVHFDAAVTSRCAIAPEVVVTL